MEHQRDGKYLNNVISLHENCLSLNIILRDRNVNNNKFLPRPSSSFLLLQSDELTPLSSGSLTKDEMSWIASILCIGGFLGTIIFGLLADLLGRKYVLCFQGIPSIVRYLGIIIWKFSMK